VLPVDLWYVKDPFWLNTGSSPPLFLHPFAPGACARTNSQSDLDNLLDVVTNVANRVSSMQASINCTFARTG